MELVNKLLLAGKYLVSLLCVIVDNTENFQINSAMHGKKKSCKCNIHVPNVNLTIYQKGVIQYIVIIIISSIIGATALF